MPTNDWNASRIYGQKVSNKIADWPKWKRDAINDLFNPPPFSPEPARPLIKTPLPCVYCGSEDVEKTWTIFLDSVSINCNKCGAVGPRGKTEYEAIQSWNDRRGKNK